MLDFFLLDDDMEVGAGRHSKTLVVVVVIDELKRCRCWGDNILAARFTFDLALGGRRGFCGWGDIETLGALGFLLGFCFWGFVCVGATVAVAASAVAVAVVAETTRRRFLLLSIDCCCCSRGNAVGMATIAVDATVA